MERLERDYILCSQSNGLVFFLFQAAPFHQFAKLSMSQGKVNYKKRNIVVILVIKLIWNVAHKINNDPVIGDRLKLIFLENYCVSLGM